MSFGGEGLQLLECSVGTVFPVECLVLFQLLSQGNHMI